MESGEKTVSELGKPITVITGGKGALAQAAAEVLREAGYEVHTPGRDELDVLSQSSVKAYFSAISPVDFLINNAGYREDGPFLKMTPEAWCRVVNTNLKGAFLCSQAVLKGMMRRKAGHILNLGSYAGLHGPAGQANYAASKAGLVGLTQSLARELGPWNIRVNCLLPGWLETKFSADVPAAAKEKALQQHVLGRFNSLTDAARTIAFLHTLDHVSGQVFQIDSRVG